MDDVPVLQGAVRRPSMRLERDPDLIREEQDGDDWKYERLVDVGE